MIDDRDILQNMLNDARIMGEGRVLRDEQPCTAEARKLILAKLDEYLNRSGKSPEFAARSMGVSSAIISQLKGSMKLEEAEPHLRAIDRWLEKRLHIESSMKPSGFVRTHVAEVIFSVSAWCTKTNCIGLVYGPSGCGKTMTLQAIRAEVPGSVYVAIDSSGLGTVPVLRNLATALRINGQIRGAALFQQIAALLRDTGRLLIIDEVHKLASRQRDDPLHVLRDLHDATGCPMLWAGTSRIAAYLKAGKTEGHDPLDQIFSRIAWWLDLTDLAVNGDDSGRRLYTVEDIRRVFAASKIRLTPDGERYLMQLANDPGFGCLRAVKHLVGMAAVVCKGQPVSEELLRGIQRERLGRKFADSVETQIHTSTRAVA